MLDVTSNYRMVVYVSIEYLRHNTRHIFVVILRVHREALKRRIHYKEKIHQGLFKKWLCLSQRYANNAHEVENQTLQNKVVLDSFCFYATSLKALN